MKTMGVFVAAVLTVVFCIGGNVLAVTWYRDIDTDGYGNAIDTIESDTQPPGYVLDGSDCDDYNASIHPGATELCDSVDNDCDNTYDEDCVSSPYVAGDFNGWNAAGSPMTETSSGIWSVSLSGIGTGRHEFKVTKGDWSWSYPGANSWFYTDDSNSTTVTFNTNFVSDGWQPPQYRLGVSADENSWTIAGDFNGWSNTDPTTAMTSLGGGIHMLSLILAPGTYQYKPVVTGTWDSISIDGRSVNTANMSVTTTASSGVVNFYVDALGGMAKTELSGAAGTLLLLTPNGGERYLTGSIVEIEYTASGEIPAVDIAFSTDHGVSWTPIASGEPNTGSYEWTIPDANSEDCLVKVISAYNSTILDISDNTFMIYSCSEKKYSDINKDCYVDLRDLALLAQDWLWCGDRYNPVCLID